MPVFKALPLVRRGRFYPFQLTLQQAPPHKKNPQVFRLYLVLHIFDVKWADEYPGCKIVIELSRDTFRRSPEQCAGTLHLRKITCGDRIVFNDYEPGFTYEFTRLLQLKDNVYYIEIVAFDDEGNYFTSESHTFFPCVITIPAHLTDPRTFTTIHWHHPKTFPHLDSDTHAALTDTFALSI
jgi:hypothetical protein